MGLGIMFGFAIVGLFGALFIRETNCHYITLDAQKKKRSPTNNSNFLGDKHVKTNSALMD
jgi:hypothetical protein